MSNSIIFFSISADIKNISFYANASFSELEITALNYYKFFLNITSELSGIPANIVEGVVNGTIIEIQHPLDCILDTFTIVTDTISDFQNKSLNVAVFIPEPSLSK